MSILVGKDTKVVTQGITGSTGQFHTRTCKEYGTQILVDDARTVESVVPFAH